MVEVREFLNIAEVASMFPGKTPGESLSTQTVARWIKVGVGEARLKSVKVGGLVMIRRADLEVFLEDLSVTQVKSGRTVARKGTVKAESVRKALKDEFGIGR